MAKRRKYDKEFKKEAVRLVLEEGRSAAEVERNLGTGSNITTGFERFRKQGFYDLLSVSWRFLPVLLLQ